MNLNNPEAGKSINRLSERRGLGSLTLNQESVLKLESAASQEYAECVINEKAGNYPVVSSKRKKMSYFRSVQQQDGAEISDVTVEELSRDCPPAGLSPASSPSSKYRALPGCSPRWPHTYHHGTIFSFPSLPSSVSSSTSHRRRRLFYPFSSVGLLACNRCTASRRLSTVVEKPVGDASIQLAYPFQNCALLVGDNTVLRPLFDLKSSPDSQVTDISASQPPLGLAYSPGPVWQAELTVNPSTPVLLTHVPSPSLSSEQHSLSSPTLLIQAHSSIASHHETRERHLSDQHNQTATVYQSTKHSCLGVVDLPSHHHQQQQLAYRVDNNRTTGNFCTNRARVVSLNSSCDGARIKKPLSPTRSDCKRNSNPSEAANRHDSSSTIQQSHVIVEDSSNVPLGLLPPVDTSAQASMDRHYSSPLAATPMTSSYAGLSPSCASAVDAQAAATNQSPSVAGPTFTSRHHTNCKTHGVLCKTCSGEARQEQCASCSSDSSLLSQCASTTHPSTDTSLPEHRPCTKSIGSQIGKSLAEPNQKATVNIQSPRLMELLNERPSDVCPLPNRPARSRSPHAVYCHAHGDAVRDRRAYSADRPLCAHYPGSTVQVPKTVKESSSSRVSTYPKAEVISSTKVERLRQLTQRLRPSSSSTSSTGKGRSPDQVQLASVAESIQNQLPPIPIAPPRHPRTRSERKKSSRSKKDSATSTSDLNQPIRPTSSIASTSQNTNDTVFLPNLENGSVVKHNETTTCANNTPNMMPVLDESVAAHLRSSPTNDIPNHQPHENLFSDNSRLSCTNHPDPTNDDVFDEVHLTLSRLNPRIMVGTYQQRTIPFRSASFSQIDVGADGTYNRRPRTSITLKPVTYSIGKDASNVSSSPYSGSLPRRLKMNERNSGEVSNTPKFHHLPEDCKEILTVPIADPIPCTKVLVSSSHEPRDPVRNKIVSIEANNESFCDKVDDSMTCHEPVQHGQFNPGETDFSESTQNQSKLDSLHDGIASKPDSIEISEQSIKAASPASTICDDSLQYVGQMAPCLTELEAEKAEPIDKACYETTEVSVSAEIRLSPLPTIETETTELDMPGNLIDAEPLANSKPLAVLDLLELNNHLLRLRAATRDTTLDRLADLEVAAQFGESVPLLSPSIDSSGASSRNSVVRSSDHSDGRPWLNELFRLATNFERDESGWNPDKCVNQSASCPPEDVVKSRDYCAVPDDSMAHSEIQQFEPLPTSIAFAQPKVDILATLPTENLARHLINQRSSLDRKSSKRRRHSSSMTGTSTVTGHKGSYTKSSRGRFLTFPPAWSSKASTMYGGIEKKIPVIGVVSGSSSLDDDDGVPVVDMGKYEGKHFVVDANYGKLKVESSSVTGEPNFIEDPDDFQSLLIATEKNTIFSKSKCSLAEMSSLSSGPSQTLQIPEKSTMEIPSSRLAMGTSLEDAQIVTDAFIGEIPECRLLIGESHYASVESDEPEDSTREENLKKSSEADEIQEVRVSQKPCREATAINNMDADSPKANHRLTVSLSVTLAPELSCTNPESLRHMSLSPYCSDLESNAFSLSTEKAPRSPQNPRRYGLKRRPLRGPYGEMLEAEMNKSEFSKMYAKRNEDLSFLRELSPRINREAKSSSPRPMSPSSGIPHIPISEAVASNWSNVTANTRQNAMAFPTSHSLDDSQLKIGYNSATLPIEISGSPRHPRLVLPKRKNSANIPYEMLDSDSEVSSHMTGAKLSPAMSSPPLDCLENHHTLPTVIENGMSPMPLPSHQRTLSSPCQLVLNEGGFTSEDEPELLELTSLSSLRRSTAQLLNSESISTDTFPVTRLGSTKRSRDTRTHAIGELYDTERSYVESLQILVTKYLQPLKGPECSGLVESNLVDEIFFQIPAILVHHEVFLEELRKRLESWDSKQCVGGVFLDTLTKPSVIETYTAYINHWKHAKEAIKTACLAKSAFSKFLEATAREHKGKLALDSLLIMPVQRIPRYELLIKMLLKHTPREHPDHTLLLDAQREVHELAVKINCVEREAYGAEQQQATLRELESLVEGLGPGNLATPERTFIRHDCVTIPSALGTRKERGFFLFSDLLVITSVKRRSAAIRKSSSYSSSGIASTLEANKFKLLMRVPLDDLEVTKNKEESSKRTTKDLEHIEEDLALLNQITELVSSLHVSHSSLDEAIKEIQLGIQRQLADKQNASTEPQLATLDLAICTRDGIETLSVAFTTSEKRASWEESFSETKLKLRAMSPERRPPPEFLMPLPIRKTRAGLQFTCAAPTVTWNTQHLNDVWVCNSDGYVGQVCILSLHPEPNVTSCNGVCNARITCIAAIPAAPLMSDESANNLNSCIFKRDSKFESSTLCASNSNEIQSSVCTNFELESSESSGSEESADEDPSSYSRYRSNSIPTEVNIQPASEEADTTNQATMWLGTEDGCIHIYHCGENIRLKKNRTRIQQGAAVLCLVYMDNCVFASLANGDVLIYQRTPNGTWSINEPQCVAVGSIIGPVTRMLPVSSGLWCASQNTIKILNTSTLTIEDQFAVSSDSQRSVLSLASNGLGVWVAMQGSAVVRLFHAFTHECICDVNLAPAVNKMLSGCDDIIRQHKAACLRVTSMMLFRDLLWVGTSAGVILTIPTPHLTPTSSRLSSPPCVTGLSHGHTGHVRFLTCVEAIRDSHILRSSRLHHTHHGLSLKSKDSLAGVLSSTSNISSHGTRLLVISGGDGYEDFRHSGLSDTVGREDSTNHLLLWQV
ncbi:uncharacterized protein LOC124338515 isoform X2 [Daphnia pulicaria]|uniref:uncharacterized protein LOC124338515 isoform X2 n=1 Tax=Daphnia pulicaria TaxID=35523 RepID=UPI001EEA5012|nr:uncharacterized protein LOC124338515 isoform X2 [Daphnia pulicaria]